VNTETVEEETKQVRK